MQNISTILSSAFPPTILISANGLLILTFSNRLNHVVDRIRSLLDSVSSNKVEVDILMLRADYLRKTILMSCGVCLLAVILVTFLFLSMFIDLQFIGIITGVLFLGAMVFQFLLLYLFYSDVKLSLEALNIHKSSKM